MLSGVFQVIMEQPLLAIVFIADIFLIFLIVSYVSSKIFGEKRPDRKIFLFFRKFFVKLKEGDSKDIASLYDYVIKTYIHKGVVSHDLGTGFKAREKILESIEGEEKKVVQTVFSGFESKNYGGGILDEQKTVSYLFDQFRAL
ncbi:MAG: hypothetical protein GOV01_01155 [Candidatus Altiarchaeota archaeon]|nr:hypothetical protein [Candidatus Altiarchaeota archaeon]